jgi:hypothetical protein
MLDFAPIDWSQPSQPLFPRPNAGLYTGTPAVPSADWAPVMVAPDANTLLTETIKSANPPPNAVYSVGSLRPGNNNIVPLQGMRPFDPAYGMVCREVLS